MNIKKIFREILAVIGIFSLINASVFLANISYKTHVIKPVANHVYNMTVNQMHYFD
jgi:hypothetical protein